MSHRVISWILILTDSLQGYEDKDLDVFIHDSSRVHFSRGEFLIVDSLGNTFIRGRGTKTIAGVPPITEIFEGNIALSDIQRIESVDQTSGAILILGATALLIILIISVENSVKHFKVG